MLGNGGYNRAVPEHFSDPERGDDNFMNSIMKNYANEEATKDGTPTGKFVFKKSHAKAAAREILETHMGLKGSEV